MTMDTLVVVHKVKEVYPAVIKEVIWGIRVLGLKEVAGALAAKGLLVVMVGTQAADHREVEATEGDREEMMGTQAVDPMVPEVPATNTYYSESLKLITLQYAFIM